MTWSYLEGYWQLRLLYFWHSRSSQLLPSDIPSAGSKWRESTLELPEYLLLLWSMDACYIRSCRITWWQEKWHLLQMRWRLSRIWVWCSLWLPLVSSRDRTSSGIWSGILSPMFCSARSLFLRRRLPVCYASSSAETLRILSTISSRRSWLVSSRVRWPVRRHSPHRRRQSALT